MSKVIVYIAMSLDGYLAGGKADRLCPHFSQADIHTAIQRYYESCLSKT